MVSSFITINGVYENVITIEKSKFICTIKGVESEQEAKEFIAYVKKIYSLATHNCYAYIADENSLICKFSDDGEPQGTAGLPILEALKATKIVKCAVVVTRYFGGIKLGAGGLVRAYNSSAVECIKKAPKLKMFYAKEYVLKTDYESYSGLISKLANLPLAILSTDFDQSVSITLAIKQDQIDSTLSFFADYFSGKQNITCIGEGFYPFN